MLSPFDDSRSTRSPRPIAHVGTSDRNFYDRYYFNCHAGDDTLMLIPGSGSTRTSA